MKRQLITTFCALLCVSVIASAQGYYVISQTGSSSDYDRATVGTTLMTAPQSDVYSTWVLLPFSWQFYGEEVTGCYVSDNGYITFDINDENSDPNNTAIPSVDGPNNAIYAFWDDFHLATGQGSPDIINTWTYGSRPNRTFVVHWSSISPFPTQSTSTNHCHFSILLHEQGGFEIVLDWGVTGNVLSATVGCENADGTEGVMVIGSPNLNNLPGDPGGQDDPVYRFIFGEQPSYDLTVAELNLPKKVSISEGAAIRGVISNFGKETITSMDLNYQVNDGKIVTASVDGFSIPATGSYNFSHPTTFTPDMAGQEYSIKVWASNLNGNPDDAPENDAFTGTTFSVLGISGEKRVFIEEFTGAWCPFCTDGPVYLDLVRDQFPQTSIVAVHGGGTDAMRFSGGDAIVSAFGPAFPQANIDRTLFEGEQGIPANRGSWVAYTAQRMNEGTPVQVSVSSAYNGESREATITVTAEFLDYAPPGDMRINVFVMESGLVGNGTGWDQVNGYNGTAGHRFFGAGNPILGYEHNDVLRAIPTGTWGAPGVIPSLPALETPYTGTYTYSVPATYNPDNMHVIAFVSYYDPNSLDGVSVLNSYEVELVSGETDAEDNIETVALNNVYPNPVKSVGFATLSVPQMQRVAVDLFDAFGTKVRTLKPATFLAPGEHRIAINTEGLAAGMYFLIADVNGEKITRQVVVNP